MNQILESLLFEPEAGRLSLQQIRYFLVRPSMLVELQKALETYLPAEAGSLLSGAAQNEGIVLASRLKEVFGYSGEEVLRSLCFLLQETGWGVVKLEMVNLENRELMFGATQSPFAEEYGPAVQPVCHVLLGLLNGAAIGLFESEVEGMEVQCQARGDSSCRFVVTGKVA